VQQPPIMFLPQAATATPVLLLRHSAIFLKLPLWQLRDTVIVMDGTYDNEGVIETGNSVIGYNGTNVVTLIIPAPREVPYFKAQNRGLAILGRHGYEHQ